MRKLISILAICLTASCGNGTNEKEPNSVMITVVDDRTDTFILKPLVEPILALYKFDEDISKAAIFRHVTITDMRHIPAEEYSLGSSSQTDSLNVNEEVDYREMLVYDFYDSIRNSLIKTHAETKVLKKLRRSECFATISRELTVIMSRNVKQRIMIIYSDGMENSSSTFSCYTPCGLKMLSSNPESIVKLFETRYPLPTKLSDVNVYFIYQPQNAATDALFLQIMNVYKSILVPKRACVHISATNKYYEQ